MLVPVFNVSYEYLADESQWDKLAGMLKGMCVAGPAILKVDGEWWTNPALTSYDEKASRSKQKPKWMMRLACAGELMLDGLPASQDNLVLTALDAGFLRVVVDVDAEADLSKIDDIVKLSNRERVAVRPAGARLDTFTEEVQEIGDKTISDKPTDFNFRTSLRYLLADLGKRAGVVMLPLKQMPGAGEPVDAAGGGTKPNGLTYFASAFRAVCRPAKLLLTVENVAEDGNFPLAKQQAGAPVGEAGEARVTERLVHALHTYSRVSLAAPAKVPDGAIAAAAAGEAAGGAASGGASSGAGSSDAAAPPPPAAAAAVAAGGGADDRLSIGRCVAMCARTDRPDSLITTVVCDLTGVAMGLVYSSVESIEKMVNDMRGVYYSRSRGGLWEKGKTSGCYYELEAIRLDCDEDALMVRVKQRGEPPAFCHHGTYTCWFENKGLGALERTLADRKKHAPEGSYTKKLMESPKMLQAKLVEESMELAEAEDKDHVAAEAADLLYFALVRCADAGVTIADVEAHLDRRALKVQRRRGEVKKHVQEKVDAMLGEGGK